MKKILVISLILFLAGALVFAGGGRAREGQVINITMANPSSPEDNMVRAFFHFRDIVQERSNGRIAVNVMHSGQLGSHRDYMEQMQMGALEMAEVNVAVLSAFDPTFMVFDLPYISRSVQHLQGLLDGGLGQRFSNSLEARTGVKILGWMIRSPRNMYTSTRPIHTAADFAGMRVRIMESPVHRRTFELLGAVPVPLAATERYMALQTGVVDAAENSIPLILSEREFEVTRYISRTEHFISPNVIAISSRFFNGLPPDLQAILVQAGDEAARFATRLDAESEAGAIRDLVNLGMVFNEVPDKSSFISRVRPIYDEFRAQIGGELIDAFTR